MADDDLFDDEESTRSPLNRRRLLLFGAIGILVLLVVSFLAFKFIFAKSKLPETSLSSGSSEALANVIRMKEQAQRQRQKEEERKRRKKIHYERLYQQLTGEQLSEVLQLLSLDDISFMTVQKGKYYDLSVDSDRLDDAKNKLALKGLPTGGIKGFALFDNASNMGVTEFDKRIRLIRALSGELEKTIMDMQGISNARVQIVLPEQRLFSVAQPPVTAAILIRKSTGAKLSDEMVYGIIQLVSNAVENLQMENITVVDTQGHILSSGIFERVSQRPFGKASGFTQSLGEKEVVDSAELPPTEEALLASNNAQAPSFEGWFDVKQRFEKDLSEKVLASLSGSIPPNQLKVMVTADFDNGVMTGVPSLKKTATSILVSKSLNVTPELKKEIFEIVALASGYVRGRDKIELKKTDFLQDQTPSINPTLQAAIPTKSAAGKPFFGKILHRVKPFVLPVFEGVAGIVVLTTVVVLVRRRFKNRVKPMLSENKEEADFGGIQEELDLDRKIARAQSIAKANPVLVAQVMESWLAEEKEVEEVTL